MKRLLCVALVGLCGCAGSGPGRPEQVWVVDLQTFSPEVDRLLTARGLDPADIAARALFQLQRFYAGFPIRFVPGTAALQSQSYICVRTTHDSALGRAILDLGNEGVDFNCGTGFGVFLDNILAQIDGQLASPTPERVSLMLAVVLAHEIGHSLGLEHTDGFFGNGDIMIGNGILDVRETNFFFIPEHRALLAVNLSHDPGAER